MTNRASSRSPVLVSMTARFGSCSSTDRPRRARSVAAVEPAGPPPMTMTSFIECVPKRRGTPVDFGLSAIPLTPFASSRYSPDSPMFQQFARLAAAAPGAPALIDGETGSLTTRSALLSRAEALADELRQAGMRERDLVAVQLP